METRKPGLPGVNYISPCLATKGKLLGRKVLGEVAGIVTPDTILRWYRKLVARKYDGSGKRGPGRPRSKQETAELVVRMARQNAGWGYTLIRDALCHLGHEIARNLTDSEDGFLLGVQYLILDRDPLYTGAFRQMLKDSSVSVVRLPARSPNLNAYAERFVLSIKSECLDRIVPLGESHLRWAVRDFVEHYHRERHHQGIDNQLIAPRSVDIHGIGAIRRRERLGGMLSFYYRKAA